MTCLACRAENPVAAKFCEECGARLPRRCSACGHAVSATAKFCLECGGQLGESSPPGPTPSTPATPQTYTPQHLAQKILAGRDALAGERKQVTVLFADVVGSTELIRNRDPEDAQRLLDGAVQRMMDAVHRYEGTVSRLMGDGLMAMFGAPVAHEDHAVRACYAALEMLEAARVYTAEVRQKHGAALQIRVGINSGEVVVRLISDDLHMDYTAMGQTVHLASRMESLAAAGSAMLATSTMALVEGLVDMCPRGPTPVKGLEEPVEVYELVGAGEARTRLQASAARGLTPFVGRQDERAKIDRALVRVRAGHGQVVALVAEPGVGKSRLLWEATQPHRAPGGGTGPGSGPAWTILEASAFSYGQSTSWLPVISLLGAYCQIDRRDDRQAMRDKVASRVEGLDPSPEMDLPALLALLDALVDDPTWATLDPPRRRRRTLDALGRLLLRLSQERPLLLIFEDLHWIDSETQTLLDELVDRLPAMPTALLVSYRPEYQHGWYGKSWYTQIRVDPLPEDGATELLDLLLGTDLTIRALADKLTARTAGNPFFLEESVRSLVEAGVLTGERGAYRLVRPVEDVRVPATVQAVLAARIDRLVPGDKRLLQRAAVIGKDVSLVLLRATAEPADDDLQGGLARLQAGELIYPIRLFPEPEYTFKHALTHEVAYGSLLQDRRKTLHARVVEALETLHPDRLDEQAELLAYHAQRAELWEQAAAYGRQAGMKAVSRSAMREAATWLEQALAALAHLPETRETLERSIDLRIDLRAALNPLGELRRAFEYLQGAERQAEQLRDRPRLGRISVSMTAYYFLTGDLDRAINTGQHALTIGTELDDVVLQAAACSVIGQAYIRQGDHPRSVAYQRQGLRLLDQSTQGMFLGSSALLTTGALSYLAWSLGELGQFDEAIERGEAALQAAQASGHAFSQVAGAFTLGRVYLTRGDVERAIVVLERGLEVCQAANLRTVAYFGVTGFLGEAYMLAGRLEESLALLKQVAERTLQIGIISDYFCGAIALIEAYRLAGQPEEALQTAVQVIDLATRYGERACLAQALHALARLYVDRDPPAADEAEQRYREARALANELEMRPLQAHCHLGRGQLYHRAGRLDEARAELTTAIAMYREMGMAFWLPEAEAALAHETVSPAVN